MCVKTHAAMQGSSWALPCSLQACMLVERASSALAVLILSGMRSSSFPACPRGLKAGRLLTSMRAAGKVAHVADAGQAGPLGQCILHSALLQDVQVRVHEAGVDGQVRGAADGRGWDVQRTLGVPAAVQQQQAPCGLIPACGEQPKGIRVGWGGSWGRCAAMSLAGAWECWGRAWGVGN